MLFHEIGLHDQFGDPSLWHADTMAGRANQISALPTTKQTRHSNGTLEAYLQLYPSGE